MKTTPLLLMAALLLGGCATSGDVQKVQSQVAETQDELANIKRTASSKEEVQNVNQRIAQQTEQLLKSNATLVAKVDQIDEKVQNTQGSIEQTNYRIDRLVQQLTQAQHDIEDLKMRAAAAAVPAVVPPAVATAVAPPPAPSMSEVNVPPPVNAAPSGNPMELYQTAYRDYQRGNFDLAIAGFADFIRQNPNSDLADNAAYWIGESLFSQKKYQDAIAQFDSVVTRYPQSDKVPGALLKKGYAYIALGEKAQGIVQLQYVVHEHPSSQEASLARQRLQTLGVQR
jgi:tol-pal system protein YbgF